MSPIATLKSPFDRMRGTLRDEGGSGEVVYDSPKAGIVTRRWVMPSNPSSPNQTTVRNALIAAAQAFRALTASVAAQWDAAAATMNRLNRLGVQYAYSGINLFCEVNAYRSIRGGSLVTTVPTKFTLPTISVASITATIAASPSNTLTVGCTSTLDPGTDTFHVLALVTHPWTRPARLPRRNDFAMRDSATPDNNFIDIQDDTATTTALLNTAIPITAGDVIHVRLTPISHDYVPGQVSVSRAITIAAP